MSHLLKEKGQNYGGTTFVYKRLLHIYRGLTGVVILLIAVAQINMANENLSQLRNFQRISNTTMGQNTTNLHHCFNDANV